MSKAREKMLAKFSNRPVLENKGFFQKAAERATQNYLNSQEEIEPTLEEQAEDATTEQRKSFFSDASSRISEAIGNYAAGAVQGAQEVSRQANRLSVSNPLGILCKVIKLGPEQQFLTLMILAQRAFFKNVKRTFRKHSCKEVETFRYYECAIPKFKELLKGGAA